MSQQMGQKPERKPEEDSPQPAITFSVDITTTAALDPTAYKIITGGATIVLNPNPNNYTGTMQFNYPVMQGQPGATQGQISWTQRTYPLGNISYQNGVLSLEVPTAVPAFLNNFRGDTGAPTPPAPAGPQTGVFKFKGLWDGSSNTITGGCLWVPPGWLEDCAGAIQPGQPSAPQCPPTGDEGEGGGDDPAVGTWTSAGGN